MIMHLDYEFKYDGRVYSARGVDIGDTEDIEHEKEQLDDNKKSAICNAFNIDIDEFEANYKLDDFKFAYCDLYN